MRELGIEGVAGAARRSSPRAPDPTRVRAPDLVSRNFTADRAQRAVGHRPDLRADVVRDRLCVLHRRRLQPPHRRLARRRRTCAPRWSSTPSRWPGGPAARASPGSSPTPTPGRSSPSVRYTERLAEIGARPSIGTVGDSYDNALAETVNGLYKTECVYGPDARRPWDASTSSSSPPSAGSTGTTAPPPQPLRRHPARRVRSSVLRCPTADPDRGWKPITRASTRPRAIHIDHARTFCNTFFNHYNHQHRHSGIGLHTPADVHHGRADTVRAQRQLVLDAAYANHPERFPRPPSAPRLPEATWIKPPEDTPLTAQAI